jgi:hypothetical protein
MTSKKGKPTNFSPLLFLLLLDPGSGIEKYSGSATLLRRVENPAFKKCGIYRNLEQNEL